MCRDSLNPDMYSLSPDTYPDTVSGFSVYLDSYLDTLSRNRFYWWRGMESNHRRLAYEANALPLSYPAVFRIAWRTENSPTQFRGLPRRRIGCGCRIRTDATPGYEPSEMTRLLQPAKLVSQDGIEPPTRSSSGYRSTTELLRHGAS